jgi:hypothetical protein
MKRTALLSILVLLVLIESWLLESFIPYGWHHPLSELLSHIFPAQEYKPHPNIGWEIEEVLRQNPSLRIGVYLLTGTLAIGNAILISKVWKGLQQPKPVSSQT